VFRKPNDTPAPTPPTSPSTERVDSVLGLNISWQGRIGGSGGVRIEGAFEGEIELDGLLLIAETGRVTCEHVRAGSVIVAGTLKGDITAQRVVIRATGRVWGNITAASFATEEGAFMQGQVRMETPAGEGE